MVVHVVDRCPSSRVREDPEYLVAGQLCRLLVHGLLVVGAAGIPTLGDRGRIGRLVQLGIRL
jgi:hypothetical protein